MYVTFKDKFTSFVALILSAFIHVIRLLSKSPRTNRLLAWEQIEQIEKIEKIEYLEYEFLVFVAHYGQHLVFSTCYFTSRIYFYFHWSSKNEDVSLSGCRSVHLPSISILQIMKPIENREDIGRLGECHRSTIDGLMIWINWLILLIA